MIHTHPIYTKMFQNASEVCKNFATFYPVKEEHIIEKPENTVIFGKKFFYDWKFSLNVVIV